MTKEELLRGRERRYFGYTADISHKVDTPESAKSFRSIISTTTKKVQRKYEPVKSFKPDPTGQSRFADKILHRAIKAQIPGLLPALKNSPQYEEHDESLKIYLRSPEFEQHKKRSLHYFWLPRNERTELCGIFQNHLKNSGKQKTTNRFIPQGKRTNLTGLAAETAILDQQEYLESIANDPKLMSNKSRLLRRRRVSDVSDRLQRMNRRFQSSYWDPTFNKNLQDPFRRQRGKLPACDAICHEHFGSHKEYRDILTCVDEYQRRYVAKLDLNGENIELGDRRDQFRRLSLFGTLEDEKRRRGFKHIKELKEYDRESEALWKKQAKLIVSAAKYINKIKIGRRFPTPPRELNKQKIKSTSSTPESETNTETSSFEIEKYMERKTLLPGVAKGQRDLHRQEWRKSKHNYDTEEFYMEMYLHFLNLEEDVSLKAPPKQMTDVKELRRMMNLDEDYEKERKLVELLNESGVEALNIHGGARRSQLHETQPFSASEVEHEKEILEQQLARLNNPRLTHELTKMMSQISSTASSLTMASDESRKTLVEEDTKAVEEAAKELTSQPPTSREGTVKRVSGTSERKRLVSTVEESDDDNLDKMGDIPDHELRLIMSEIAVSSRGSGSTDNMSSGSSGGDEEEEGEGEDGGDDEVVKLFKKARKKKDSLAELMDLTTEFRARVCQEVDAHRVSPQLNPFAEAVCILYPEGSDKKGGKKKQGATGTRISNSGVSVVQVKSNKSSSF